MNTQQAYLLLGSNLNDRRYSLKYATCQIQEKCGTILKKSAIYRSKAWGVTNQPDFLNQILIIETQLAPRSLLESLLDIEQQMGRVREIKWHSRLIDIDILFFGEEVIDIPGLQIPHPRLAERNFTLVPLMEIAPQFIHPTFAVTIEELYLRSADTLEVQMIEN